MAENRGAFSVFSGPKVEGDIAEAEMFGAGRPRKHPSIDRVRELDRRELEGLTRGRAPAVKRFRDTHHMIARLCAMGLRPREIAARCGYSLIRISNLRGDPAFEELIANYRDDVDQSWREELDDFFGLAIKARNTSMRMIVDQLEDAEQNGDKVPLRSLLSLQADLSDRTGYGKRSTQINVNVDFAAQLDRAIKRSQSAQPHESNGSAAALVETEPGSLAPADSPACGEARLIAPQPEGEPRLFKRRV